MVTYGDYSDYRVSGIFSTKEKAKEYIKFMSNDNKYAEYNDVEVLEIDEYYTNINDGLTVYQGNMDEYGNIQDGVRVDEGNILSTYYMIFTNCNKIVMHFGIIFI